MYRRLANLYRSLFRRRHLENELDEEVRTAFEMTVDKLMARGLSPADARRAARIDFEGLEQVKESVRDSLVGSTLQVFAQDASHAWRALWRRPSFALIVLVTLALGIGVNTAIFSVFYGMLLHPLPYRDPGRLVRIWANYRDAGTRAPVSGPMFAELQRSNRAFADVAGIWVVAPRTFVGDEPEMVKSARVTSNFFDVLGVYAAHGRVFRPEDSGAPSVILTDGVFRRRFAGNTELVGHSIPLQDSAATLVGVLPRDFQLQFAPDANIPPDVQTFDPFGAYLPHMTGRFLRIVARLKPGVTLAEAQRDVERVAQEFRAANASQEGSDLHFEVANLQQDAFGDIQPALTALFAGAAFVLLICCVNVTSLLLARASERRKEIALRLTLGASQGRILRQLLAESCVLCILGGAGGIAVGWAGFRALLAIRPDRLERLGDGGLSWPVLTFAAFTTCTAALIFGLAPALASFRLDLIATLRATGGGWLGKLHRRAGTVLVAGEIALGFVLVTGAALTARSLSRIEQVHPGFQPQHVLTFQLPFRGDPNGPALHEWESELAAIPGVQSVGAISHLPLDRDLPNWFGSYQPRGMTGNQTEELIADYRSISPGYFAAMGARLTEGRIFDQQDGANSRPVIIVDEVVARAGWHGQSPLGEQVQVEETTRTIVGVVEHVRNQSLTEDLRGVVYMPHPQSFRSPLTYVVRTSLPPLSLAPAVRAKVREHTPGVAIAKIRPMTAYVDRALAPAGFTAVLAMIFGALALLLAATGIYGVLNYQVSRRLPEMGIRMAVGASARDVLRLVLREGLGLTLAGVLAGCAGMMLAARWLGTVIFGVSPRDPASFALALFLLPAVALLGCWRPAMRAAHANPADVIRED